MLDALRNLCSRIYSDTGHFTYSGDCESEIKELITAIKKEIKMELRKEMMAR